MSELIVATPRGLYCPAGGFHIDASGPVDVTVTTHAHGDHARPGAKVYYAAAASMPILRHRLGSSARLRGLEYGERVQLGAAWVSLHPAGHILGSAQVRIETGQGVWVVSGDYKREADPTCAPFELLACDVFVTEATFALPVFRWPAPASVAREILSWWDEMRALGRPALLACYGLGKAQRILAELHRVTDRVVHVHAAMEPLCRVYRNAGVAMLATRVVAARTRAAEFAGTLVLMPPAASGTPWVRQFGRASTAFASGWMQLRAARRRRAFDRGFVLSDHADWSGLNATIVGTGARRVLTMHGYAATLARWLREQGTDADVLDAG